MTHSHSSLPQDLATPGKRLSQASNRLQTAARQSERRRAPAELHDDRTSGTSTRMKDFQTVP